MWEFEMTKLIKIFYFSGFIVGTIGMLLWTILALLFDLPMHYSLMFCLIGVLLVLIGIAIALWELIK